MAEDDRGQHPALPRPYSKAFDNFVNKDDDLEGLLAYALFKQTVREQAGRGALTGNDRDPPPSMVKTFRAQAEQKLMEFGFDLIDGEKPSLQSSAMLTELQNVRLAIIGELQRRTAWPASIGANLVAWVITLALTVLIVTAWNKPDPTRVAVDAGKVAEEAATKAAQKTAADVRAMMEQGGPPMRHP